MERIKLFNDTEVQAIKISGMKINDHIEFTDDVLTIVSGNQAILQNLGPLLQAFRAAVEEETTASLLEENSGATKNINDAVDKRNKVQTAFKAGARATEGMPDVAVQAAGKAITELTHKYDAHIGMKPTEQTGMLKRLIVDIENNYMEQIQTAGLSVLFQALKDANDEVCRLYLVRDHENASRVIKTATEARKVTDAAYHRLIRGINSLAFVVDAEPYEQTIADLNALILRYKRTVTNQPTAGPTVAPGDEVTGEDEVEIPGDDNTNPGDNTNPSVPGDSVGGDNNGGNNGNQGGNQGGNNGGYPPGYDPDADDDPGV